MGFPSPISFVRAKWAWAKEKPLFWANLGLITLTYLCLCIYPGPVTEAGPSDFRIRTWGMALQLLGAAIVWLDLTDSARKFGKGGFLKSTWDWIKAGIFGRAISISGSGSGGIAIGGTGRIKQRRNLGPNASLDSRLEALEFNLSRIDTELTSAFQAIEDSAAKLKDQIKEESRKRDEAHKELQKSLREAIVGNYTKLAFGAAWVVVGIIISAWAPEITKIVAGQSAVVLQTI